MKTHIQVCIGLGLLIIPVAIADFTMLKSSSGGWISLNLRGVFIGLYLLFLPVHILISTLAVKGFPGLGLWANHLASAFLSILFVAVGLVIFSYVQKRYDHKQYQAQQAARKLFENVIQLNSWRYSPNPETASDLFVTLTISESGRLAVGAGGKDDGDQVEWYFHSDRVPQRHVTAGEQLVHRIPLKRSRDGIPKNIEITVYLFADSTGSAGTDILKIFTTDLKTDDDGHYFYGRLPQPSPN